MMANAALLAVLTTFLAVGWLAGELSYLARYRVGIFRNHGWFILGAIGVVFLNLCAIYYSIGRWLLLRDTGRKLSHIEGQMGTSDAILRDLGRHRTP